MIRFAYPFALRGNSAGQAECDEKLGIRYQKDETKRLHFMFFNVADPEVKHQTRCMSERCVRTQPASAKCEVRRVRVSTSGFRIPQVQKFSHDVSKPTGRDLSNCQYCLHQGHAARKLGLKKC
jgi:hypothetical protein